jgi:hypothetical protein
VRLDFLLAENLAHRALHQIGETFVPCRRGLLACMAVNPENPGTEPPRSEARDQPEEREAT